MRSRTVSVAGLMALTLMSQALAAAPAPARTARTEARSASSITVEDAINVAVRHLRRNHAALGLGAADVSKLAVSDAYRSAHNGVTHVYLEQLIGGIAVRGSAMTVNVTSDGEVLHLGSRFMSGINEVASGGMVLSAEQALRKAAARLGLGPVSDVRTLEPPAGAERATVLSDSGIALSSIPARLVYQPSGDELRLAWNLEIEEISEKHWWNVSIDATTGELLDKLDYVHSENAEATAAAVDHAGEEKKQRFPTPQPPKNAIDYTSYRVFPLPLESPTDGGRKLMRNPADALASPWGWLDTDGKPGVEYRITQGNNTHAYVDYTGVGNLAIPILEANGGQGLKFDFELDFSRPPHQNRDAAITNLFYWNNVIHDLLYRYGFTEKAGNFQVNNYGRGGDEADPVQAEAQDHGGANNANFATPPDGRSPRMQMYLWPNTPHRQLIDGDFDAGVIVHEYAHGVSNRLTGGPDKTDCLSSHDEREGEGWSDFLAIALTALPGEKGENARGMGTYVLGQENRQQKGIRPTPYSTNKTINPATYDSIKSAAEPHGVGYVWATMLWEVYWNLVDKHGFNPNPYESWRTGGNNLAIQLVMDGMKMQPCEPGFVDARDAILAADKALTDGDNQCEIWAGFAKRGLGYEARQKSPASKTDGVQDFKTHPACR
ncbi:MAG: M36 family metallopeptidase [Actinomycetota bacterium]